MLSKFICIARSGKTIDGRELTPEQIDQMAETYDPKVYGARIWCEHLRSLLPDGAFKAYGDVVALKAETDADGNHVLLAQIDATEDLMKLNAERQKIFWSIELDPNFADSGKAYMAGLAITDSPASLGTEMIKFSIEKQGTDKAKTLYSKPFDPGVKIEEAEAAKPSVLDRVTALFNKKDGTDAGRFKQLEDSTLAVAEEVAALKTAATGKADAEAVTKLRADFDALKASLEGTPSAPSRQKSDGSGDTSNFTDC